MQIQDFLKVYQAKSDEELLRLATAPDQLASEAQFALQSELSRRQIKIAEDSGTHQNDADRHEVRSIAASERLQEGKGQGVGDFVAEVLRTYHRHYWLFFTITAPAVIISTIAITTGRNEGREIARHLPRGAEMLTYKTEILEIWLANVSPFLVSWMAFSFAFGAICIAVEENASGFTPSAWHSFLNIRERLGPFVRLCLLLFVLVGAVVAGSAVLATAVLFALRQLHFHPSRVLITVVSYGFAGLALLVLSRLALAVPALILDDCTVRQSLSRSSELTRGKWLVLAALLAKSLIGGYVAAMCPFWLASLVHLAAPLPPWFPWVLTLASVIGVSVIEPTVFVGFVLLYLKMSTPSVAPNRVLASQFS